VVSCAESRALRGTAAIELARERVEQGQRHTGRAGSAQQLARMAEETDFSAHPHAGEGGDITNPVVVQPAIYMVTLPEWDDRTAMCTARYRVCYRWTDPRLAGWPEDKDVPADLWVPELALWGTISDATTEMLEQKKHAAFGSISFDGGSASSRAEGRLFFAFHFVTETLECKASTDIESFPLDSHCVDITISIGKTIAGCATKVAFDPSSVDSALTSGVSTGMDNVPQDDDEWIVDRVIWGYTEHGSAASGLQYHDLMLRFERRRDAGWYVVRSAHLSPPPLLFLSREPVLANAVSKNKSSAAN